MDLAYESGALKGDLTPIQYWALAYYLVSQKADRREELEVERKWNAFFTNRQLFEEVFLKDETQDEDSSAEMDFTDLEEADRLLAELDRMGEVTIDTSNAGEWI